MERKLDLKKGDKCVVAIEPHSSRARRVDMSIDNINQWTYEGEVLSAGKKYITVKFDYYTEKFVIKDDYEQKWDIGGADYKLYKDIQEVRNERANEQLYYKIQLFFGSYGKPKLPLEKTKEVLELIKDYI